MLIKIYNLAKEENAEVIPLTMGEFTELNGRKISIFALFLITTAQKLYSVSNPYENN